MRSPLDLSVFLAPDRLHDDDVVETLAVAFGPVRPIGTAKKWVGERAPHSRAEQAPHHPSTQLPPLLRFPPHRRRAGFVRVIALLSPHSGGICGAGNGVSAVQRARIARVSGSS